MMFAIRKSDICIATKEDYFVITNAEMTISITPYTVDYHND